MHGCLAAIPPSSAFQPEVSSHACNSVSRAASRSASGARPFSTAAATTSSSSSPHSRWTRIASQPWSAAVSTASHTSSAQSANSCRLAFAASAASTTPSDSSSSSWRAASVRARARSQAMRSAACCTYAARARAHASSMPGSGHRPSFSPLATSSGRGASSGSDALPSKRSTRPGAIRHHTACTTPASTAQRCMSAHAAAKTFGMEATRSWNELLRTAQPKPCTPLTAATAAMRVSAAPSSHACMPPRLNPATPMRAASTSGRVSR
mmetsp:Transcript_21067/g.63049  ORF Transcript_21067/g.63049 Transcript_21067/m.63049 type:complete len:266 (+) Transcript_21067:418-1215(+)